MEQSKEHSCGVLEKVPLMKKMKNKGLADWEGEPVMEKQNRYYSGVKGRPK